MFSEVINCRSRCVCAGLWLDPLCHYLFNMTQFIDMLQLLGDMSDTPTTK